MVLSTLSRAPANSRPGILSSSMFAGAMVVASWVPATSAPLTISSTDLWNGATVTSNSPIHPSSNINNMFGALGGSEPGNAVFIDGQPINTTHYVEWTTGSAITLKSFVLFAAHDGPGRDADQRGFNHFELYAFVGGSYQSIFSYDTPTQFYGDNVAPPNAILETNATKNALFLGVNLLPVSSNKFRAEFVQYGPAQCCESGPRILELDGYGTHLAGASTPSAVPVPAALPLFVTGLGVMGLLGWRRRRKVRHVHK
ncbi:MAG: PEP-CTERM sorting domain-containing protein [Hyphomicrobiales bacterium]|nr:PEP-CTERM sorting domain-containing protein [Hyphomicrobiales bacterium]